MKNIPTDLEILNTIYDRYYETFVSFSNDSKSRSSKVYVPIDIELLAKTMDVDVDVIFGRLYYHLEHKYSYDKVSLFTLKAGKDENCINFPYLTSILADMRNEDKKYRRAIAFSTISATISIISLIISLINFLKK